MIDWNRFVELVRAHRRFLLTCHVRPDCDCLGSELGMAGILDALGKDVRLVNPQSTPPNLAFIDPTARIETLGEDLTAEEAARWPDAILVLDTSSWAQLGPMGEVLRLTRATRMVLDHHVVGDDLGAIEFKDHTADATGSLVALAAEHLGVPLTAHTATPLFAAVATDTGWFRFNSTTAETFRVAARLLDAGARPDRVYAELYEQDTLARVRLRGRILDRIETELSGRLVHTYVRTSDYAELGALPTDTEDLVNLTLAVAGSEVAAIVCEQLDGQTCKISFRSRGALDCSAVARRLGGGGHKAAAGAMLTGPFEECRRQAVAALLAAM